MSYLLDILSSDDVKRNADQILMQIEYGTGDITIPKKCVTTLKKIIEQWESDLIPWPNPTIFVAEQMDRYSRIRTVDVSVLKFISHIVCKHEYGYRTLESLFKHGYCLHFARMLNDVFQRGWISITYPINHVVWQDVNGTSYDIFGVFVPEENNAKCLIPYAYFPEELLAPFWHADVRGSDDYNTDAVAKLEEMCKKYMKDYGIK